MFPREKHFAVVGDLVLPFLCSKQAVRIDILEANKYPLYAGALTFFDEVGKFVAEGIDLDDKTDLEPLDLAKFNELVEDLFPILISREIVVGNKKGVQPLLHVGPNYTLDIFRRT